MTLLRVGFAEPRPSPAALVVSYTTVSPLPPVRAPTAVCSLWHCPAGHPGWLLATTLPFGVRTFLGAPEGATAAARPTRLHRQGSAAYADRGTASTGRGPLRSVATHAAAPRRRRADRIWVEDSGGDGPPALLLHPGIADSSIWDDVWSHLADRCRLVRFDVRAYGRSPRATEPYTVAGDALAVLDHLGIPAAHLAGVSMGGGASMDLAVLHPERVLSLTLLVPGVNGYPWPDEPELEAQFERLVAEDDQEGLLEFGLRLWAASDPTDPRVRAFMRAAGDAAANEEEFQRKVEPTYDRLHEIAVPTVMVVGDLDNPTLVEADLAAAARIPGCRLVRLPGVDHYPTLREPELVLRIVADQLGVEV